MATATKTWAFATTSESWTGTASGTGNTCTYASGVGNPAGSIQNSTTGKNAIGAGHWDISATWASLFGISTNAVVTNILVSGDSYQGKCATYTTGASSTDGPLELRDSAGTTLLLTLVTGRTYSAVDASWVSRTPTTLNQAIPSGSQPATTTITFRLNGAVKTGNSSSAVNTLNQDTVVITITYNIPATVAITGVAATFAAGATTEASDANVAITGVNSVSAAGSVIAGISNNVAITGVAAATAVGTVAATVSKTVAITGVAAISSAAAPAGSIFSYYRPIIIDHTKVGADLTNFAALVLGAYSYLATVGNGGLVQSNSGFDIGFFSDSALTQKLDWELRSYSGSDGSVCFWVRVPNVSASVDTTIYLAYGASSITTDQSNKAGVWPTAVYQNVWHLDTLVSSLGTTSSADSVGNDTVSRATASAPSSATGQILNAAQYISGNTLTNNAWSFPDNTVSAITISTWMNVDPSVNYSSNILGSLNERLIFDGTTGKMQLKVVTHAGGASQNTVTTSAAIAYSTWKYVVGVYDGSNLNIYINGVLQTTSAALTGAVSTNTGLYVADNNYVGYLDEARIAKTASAAGQILTEYNNQLSPATFYNVGAQTIIPGITGAANAAATGVSAASAVGNVVASAISNATVNIVGVNSQTSVAAVVASGAANKAVVGVSSNTSVGAATESGAANVSVGSVAVTASVASTTENGTANLTITGVASVTSIGAVSGSGLGNVSVTGVSSSNAVAAVIESGTANVNSGSVVAISSVSGTTENGLANTSISGVAAAASVANTTNSGDALVSLTGVSSTFAVGTVVAGVSVNAAITGVSSSTAVGSVTEFGASNVNAVGVDSTFVVANVIESGTANTNASSVVSTTSAGQAIASGNATISVSGVASTSAVSLVSALGTASASVVGVSATSFVNTVTESGDSNSAITGVDSSTNVGNSTSQGTANVAISGVELQTAVGDVSFDGSINVDVIGVSATSVVNDVVVKGTATTTIIGVVGSSSVGDVIASASNGATVDIFGVAAVLDIGTVIANGLGNVAVLGASVSGIVSPSAGSGAANKAGVGVSSTFSVGTVSASASSGSNVSIIGVSATASVSALVTSATATTAVLGIAANTGLGQIGTSASASATIGGVTSTTFAGLVNTAVSTILVGVSGNIVCSSLDASGTGNVSIVGVVCLGATGTVTATSIILAGTILEDLIIIDSTRSVFDIIDASKLNSLELLDKATTQISSVSLVLLQDMYIHEEV